MYSSSNESGFPIYSHGGKNCASKKGILTTQYKGYVKLVPEDVLMKNNVLDKCTEL